MNDSNGMIDPTNIADYLPDGESIDPRRTLMLVRKDLRKAAETLTIPQARFLVDQYYAWQDFRIQSTNQVAALTKTDEPHEGVAYIGRQHHEVEQTIAAILDSYTKHEATGMGLWARDVVGIGPVIAAGLLANVSMEHCVTVGHLWSFAGLNPAQKWLGRDKAATLVSTVLLGFNGEITTESVMEMARQANRRYEYLERAGRNKSGVWTKDSLTAALAKRPWNARFRVLCWKAGESFVKVSARPNDIYGKVYLARKEGEQRKNFAGDYADQARQKLQDYRIGKDTDAYRWYSGGFRPVYTEEAGWVAEPRDDGTGVPMLPPAHIHARAKRYAVKAFLADYWSEAYVRHYGHEPPLPYAVEKLGHAHVYSGLEWVKNGIA